MAEPSISGIFGKPFKEQVDYWRNKKDNLVPTERWTDMQKEAHDKGFTVAGATKADLLADLAGAVGKAIENGATLQDFRSDFADIVKRHGWQYKGGFEWRTRVIYQTNLAVSYAAGRLVQLQEYPWWVYRHSGKRNYRPQHKSWDSLTLPADHEWWKTHYPPNGWGCGCRVVGVRSPEDAGRFGGRPGMTPPNDGTDPKTGLPKGIGKGWDYMPGASNLQKPAPSAPTAQNSDKENKSEKPPDPKEPDKPALKSAGKEDNKPGQTARAPENAAAPRKPISHSGFTYGTGWFAPLAEKIQTLPAPLGSALAQDPVFKKGIQESFSNWLTRIKTGEHLPPVLVGAFTRADLKDLKAHGIDAPTSEILLREGLLVGPKAVRHQKKGDALPDEVWGDLPALLEKPAAVVFDPESNHLIYYLETKDERSPQMVIEVGYALGKEKVNMIVSAYRPKTGDIQGRIKGGRLKLLRGNIE